MPQFIVQKLKFGAEPKVFYAVHFFFLGHLIS